MWKMESDKLPARRYLFNGGGAEFDGSGFDERCNWEVDRALLACLLHGVR
jgi:hypothetical protein